MPGTLFVVATPIGNLDDLTNRALRTLREATVIAAEDTRHTARLLAHYGITTPATSLHEHNEEGKSAALVARLERGDDIALVSDAGTPGISDPGRRLVRAARKAGYPIVPIPGPSAVVTALSASGLPADTFTFLGFPPTRSKDRKQWLSALASAGRTAVFFEAPHRIQRTLQDIQATLGDIELFIAREITKRHETLVIGPISVLLAGLGEPRGEFTVVVDLGQKIEIVAADEPKAGVIAHEFGLMTENRRSGRRAALAELGRKYGLSANQVYEAVERGKKSVD